MKYIFGLVILLQIQIINATSIDKIIEMLEKDGEKKEEALHILTFSLNNYDKVIPYLIKILNAHERNNHMLIVRIVRNRINDKIIWKKAFLEVIKNSNYSEYLRVKLMHSICIDTQHGEFLIPQLFKIFKDNLYLRGNKKLQSSCLELINLIKYQSNSVKINSKLRKQMAELMYKVIISQKKHLKFDAMRCLSITGLEGQEYRKKIFELSKTQKELMPLVIRVFDEIDKSNEEKKQYLEAVFSTENETFILRILFLFGSKNYEFFPVLEKLLTSSSKAIKIKTIETIFLLYSKHSNFIEVIEKYKYDCDFQKNIIEFFIVNDIPKKFIPFVIEGLYSKQRQTEQDSLICLRKSILTKKIVDEIAEFINRTSYEENAEFARWSTLEVLKRRKSVPNEMKRYIDKTLNKLK